MDNEILVFIIAGLATYRLTRLIVDDEIFAPIRNKILNRFNPEYSKFGYILTCTWCSSVWVALLVVISGIIIPTIAFYIGLVLALSAVAGYLTAHE
jgi:hypothetical protein